MESIRTGRYYGSDALQLEDIGSLFEKGGIACGVLKATKREKG